MNFDEAEGGSSQDFGAFIGLQIPTDNLHDMNTSKMEELVDYEGSEKDDQRWTDGFREGNPPADELELEDISGSLIEFKEMTSITSTITNEMDDRPTQNVNEKALAIDVEMPEATYSPKIEEV